MWCFWSSKGGVGCTVVATGAALGLAARRPTLLVDLGGDVPAVLGQRVEGFGLADWLDAVAPPPDALARIEIAVGEGLAVLPWRGEHERSADPSASTVSDNPDVSATGTPDLWADPSETLARMIALDHREVVVDLGQLDRSESGSARSGLVNRLLSLASRSTLVTRPCYLAIRSAERHRCPDDVVMVGRQGRSLGASDVQSAIGAPVVAKVRWDAAVARAVDAGLAVSRLPRSLRLLADLSAEVVA